MQHRRPTACFGGVVASAIALAAALPAAAATETAACTRAALAALAVPGVTVTSAEAEPESDRGPALCHVLGTVATTGEGAPDGSARFALRLPVQWNGKFLFWGVGGLAGNLIPSVTRTDIHASVAKGYAIAITDTGHEGNGLEAAWALTSPGVADAAKLADYDFRAVHQVTIAAGQLVKGYFGRSPARSYFDGCSNGGREALIEAERYPDDYDGIIAGAPLMDLRVILAGAKAYQSLLDPAGYIPAALLPAIDKAVNDTCDAADGTKDGLIQNPAQCSFDPKPLLCPASGGSDCLTKAQADAFGGTYLAPLKDGSGRVIVPGAALGDFSSGGLDAWVVGTVPPAEFDSAAPWPEGKAPLSWQFTDQFIRFIVERDPGFDFRRFKIGKDGVVDPEALKLFDARTGAANADDPAGLAEFVSKDKKLLIYHGYSDPALPAYRTVRFYEDLAARNAGDYGRVQRNVRLFMAPNMHHCGGGTGPNAFDTVTALERWVEQGQGPDAIPTAHFPRNDPRLTPDRTMPLCPFPAEAKYGGKGDVNDGANWSCTPNRDLLAVGPAGRVAGLSAQR